MVSVLSRPVVAQSAMHLRKLVNEAIELHGNSVDLNHIDVSAVTSMVGLFESLDFQGNISEWNVSSVETMERMFEHCSFNGDISKWNTGNCKSMLRMFKDAQFSGDLSAWNTQAVLSTSNMFENSAFNGDVRNWTFKSLLNMKYMFKNSAFSGDISSWVHVGGKYSEITMAQAFASPAFQSDLPRLPVHMRHDKAAALHPLYRGHFRDRYSAVQAAYLFESKSAFNRYLQDQSLHGLNRLHIEKGMTDARPRWLPKELREWLHLEKNMCFSLGLGLAQTQAHVYAQYKQRLHGPLAENADRALNLELPADMFEL